MVKNNDSASYKTLMRWAFINFFQNLFWDCEPPHKPHPSPPHLTNFHNPPPYSPKPSCHPHPTFFTNSQRPSLAHPTNFTILTNSFKALSYRHSSPLPGTLQSLHKPQSLVNPSHSQSPYYYLYIATPSYSTHTT